MFNNVNHILSLDIYTIPKSMSQNLELANVINKIRHLSNKTVDKGATESEAMSAMSKVGELLQVYNLSLDQVFLQENACVKSVIETNKKQVIGAASCIVAIGRFCDLRVWQSSSYGTVRLNLFGMETDIAMAKYLFDVIEKAIDSEVERYKNSEEYLNYYGHRRRLTASFRKGMEKRISHRLNEMSQNRKGEERLKTVHTPTGECSIVHIKKNKIDSEFEKLGLNLRTVTRKSFTSNHSAYNAGMAAGGRINLNRPVGSTNRGLLT